MTEKLLHGADVMLVFEQVRGERVPERVTRRPLGDACTPDGVLYGSLEDGFVQVMAASLAGDAFYVDARGGEDPLSGGYTTRRLSSSVTIRGGLLLVQSRA